MLPNQSEVLDPKRPLPYTRTTFRTNHQVIHRITWIATDRDHLEIVIRKEIILETISIEMIDPRDISRIDQETIELQNDTFIVTKPLNAINAICVAGTAATIATTDHEHQIDTDRQTRVDMIINIDPVDMILFDPEIELLAKVDFDRTGVEIRRERTDRLIEMTGTNPCHDQTIVHQATITAIKSEPMNKNPDKKDKASSLVISFTL